MLNLSLGNKLLIKQIEDKYPVKVKCKYEVNPGKIDWGWISENPNAIDLLSQKPDKIDWYWLSWKSKCDTIIGSHHIIEFN